MTRVSENWASIPVATLELVGIDATTIAILEQHCGLYVGHVVFWRQRDLEALPQIGRKRAARVADAVRKIMEGTRAGLEPICELLEAA